MIARLVALSILALFAASGAALAETSVADEHGVDCWMPRWEVGMKNPRWGPMRPALEVVEKAVKSNRAFVSQIPERVRMEISVNGDDGTLGFATTAYPKRWGSTPYWTSTGCNIIASTPSRVYEHPLGRIVVNFNRGGLWRGDYFNQSGLKPVRRVSGFPVFEYRQSAIGAGYELLMITRGGRLPITPVTLADRLDQEAAFLAKRLDEVRTTPGRKPPASVEVRQHQELDELTRQVSALRAYRATFSADQLRAPWVRDDGGPQTPAWRHVEAEVRVLQTLPPTELAHVRELGARARALQLQARTRGTTPDAAATLRQEANTLLNQANALASAQQQRVAAQVAQLRNEYRLQLIRPGDVSEANEFKQDPTFFDDKDPTQIRLITVDFTSFDSPETTAEEAKTWMDSVEASFDYAALQALIQ